MIIWYDVCLKITINLIRMFCSCQEPRLTTKCVINWKITQTRISLCANVRLVFFFVRAKISRSKLLRPACSVGAVHGKTKLRNSGEICFLKASILDEHRFADKWWECGRLIFLEWFFQILDAFLFLFERCWGHKRLTPLIPGQRMKFCLKKIHKAQVTPTLSDYIKLKRICERNMKRFERLDCCFVVGKWVVYCFCFWECWLGLI